MKRVKLETLWPWHSLILVVMLGTVFLCDQAVAVVAQHRPVYRAHTLVLDAGHGGEDGGAISCTGGKESDRNLEITLRLGDLLTLLGYRTVMIRTTDTAVYTQGDTLGAKKVSDLKNRVKRVRETENPLLVSIHQNHFPDSRYSGAQVFYAGNGESEALAKAIQAALVATVNPGSRRQAKQARGIYLLEQISCPGVLVECGFLSNPREEAKLRSADYQKQLCCVIAATLSQFLTRGT